MGALDGIEVTLRRWGIDVDTGWVVSGRPGAFTPSYVIVHHTASPDSGPAPARSVVRTGRPDLNGPLCNLLARRDNRIELVSRGKANHAGAGQWGSIPTDEGNTYGLGIEIEHCGTSAEPWTAEFMTWLRVVEAACLDHLNVPASRLCAHKEYAPSRKIDPYAWNMGAERAKVAAGLAAGPVPVKPPTPKEIDAMFIAWNDNIPWLVDGSGKRKLSPANCAELKTASRNVGREILDIGGVSSTLLGEFPSYEETGVLAGSSFNDLQATKGGVTQLRADVAALSEKVDALGTPDVP